MECKRKECNSEMPMGKPLAMAVVPWQKWRDVMDGKCGLEKGTIFEELVLPFYGAKAACDPAFNRGRSCDVCKVAPPYHASNPEPRYSHSDYQRNVNGMGRRCDCR